MKIALTAIITMVGLLAAPCLAQHDSVPTMNPSQTQSSSQSNETALDQLKNLGANPAEKFENRMLRQRLKDSKGKTKAELLAEDKASAVAMVADAKLSCVVANALQVAEDAAAHTKTYEVACENGVGYFLVQPDPPGKLSGFTCFAAEAARQADIASQRQPSITCGLPENSVVNVLTASILSRAGRTCIVKEIKWRGRSATTDFLETSCQEGPGYILRSPLPGSQAPLHIDTCSDSARNGLNCLLPGNDTTLATFKAALAQHKVSCDAEAARVIGHEAVKQRQVVEYFCPKQQPNGLVAFLPAEGATAPFEVLDCPTAAKRQAVCTLTKPQ